MTLQQYPGALLYTSDLVADQQGFFEDNGLSVDFVNPGDGATSMQLLANGKDTQGVIGDISGGLSARSKGQPIVAVGSVINKNLFQIRFQRPPREVPATGRPRCRRCRARPSPCRASVAARA